MSSAPGSGLGFVGVRGRGYRPEQVDRALAGLEGERDEARERVARLTAQVEDLSAETVRLREVVAGLAPQDYASLGERAQRILALAEGEAGSMRSAAQEEAQALRDAADEAGRAVRGSARADAETMRAAAGEYAEETLATARTEAEGLVAEARTDAEETREQARFMMEETRRRTESVLVHQEQEHADRWKTAEEEVAEAEAAQVARHDELTERAEAGLAEARRELARAEEEARHTDENAEARAAELVAEGRLREERVVRETERILREHEEAREELHAHMTYVRNTLAALTGRVVPDPTEEAPEAEPESDVETGTGTGSGAKSEG
ncbi:cellulose-binding protein [Streptomyces sp. NPDC014646]|uniref:cellulose-binding protein n=1 Tax=unclassified Streptomyces TaxID=2593676 RepID=UPI0036FF8DF6